MPDAAPASAAPDLDLVSAMVEGAYALGMAACERAKVSKDDLKAFMAASAEFRQCFFAVRMGIRLKMILRAGVKSKAEAQVVELEPVERERPETERPVRDRERDEERDREPVSLPAFLKSLGVVVRNAERHGDQLPAHAVPALTRLRGLLAEAKAASDAPVEPPTAPERSSMVGVLERPLSPPNTRSRLLGSAAAPPRGPPFRLRRG